MKSEGTPRALGLLEDVDEAVLDLCYRLDARAEPDELTRHLGRNDEYERIELLPSEAPARALAGLGGPLVPTVEPLLALLDASDARGTLES